MLKKERFGRKDTSVKEGDVQKGRMSVCPKSPPPAIFPVAQARESSQARERKNSKPLGSFSSCSIPSLSVF